MKRFLHFLIVLIFIQNQVLSQADSLNTKSVVADSARFLPIDFAHSKLGMKYGRKGYDCSGLVMKAFKSMGVDLPHSSALQSKLGEKVTRKEAKQGDLIFFSSGKSGKKKVGHVGIVVEVLENNIKFIHSAIKGGVKYDWLNQAYYQKHFLFIKRNYFGQID